MEKIDVFVIDEHHEVFQIIYQNNEEHAVQSIFVNIDEHHDFSSPIINRELIFNLNKNNLDELVHSNLRISDFIIALTYYKLIGDSYWISNNNKVKKIFYNINEIDVDIDKIQLFAEEANIFSEKKHVFNEIGINDLANIINSNTTKQYILSIDLDFFASNDLSAETFEIEITSDEYKRYKNKNHKLRLMFGSRVKAFSKFGKYYYQYNLYDGKLIPKHTLSTVSNKIDIFRNQIGKILTKPSYIVVCKSIKSSYVDLDYYDLIYSSIMQIIKEKWEILT